MKLGKIAFAAATLGAAALVTPVSATTLQRLEFDQVVDSASVIVVARATGSTSAMVNGELVTQTTFSVSDVASGKAGKRITVSTPGGKIRGGKVRMGEVVAGVPVFPQGSSALLFLQERADGSYGVVGFNQGAFGAFEDGGESYVRLPGSARAITTSEAVAQIKSRRGGQVE